MNLIKTIKEIKDKIIDFFDDTPRYDEALYDVETKSKFTLMIEKYIGGINNENHHQSR